MADDFKALVAAQKETTRMLMTSEERAVADEETAVKSLERSESARRGWETRQENLNLKIANSTDKSGAANEEEEEKSATKDDKILGYLKDTAGFLGGIAKQGMQKLKSGLGGLSKFLIGGLAVAALAFLDHPKFKEMIALLTKTIIPLLATFYNKVLVPIGESLAKLFEDIMLLLDGDKSLMSVLMENKLAIAGIVTALAPGLVFGALMSSAKLLIGAVKIFAVSMHKSYLAQLATNAAAGAGGKAGILGTMKALGSTMLKFTGIAALIYAAVVGIFQGAKDAYAEFQATGSIWESIKTFLASFIANATGAILDPIKDGISWVIGKIGSIFGIESFTNASKAMDEFSFVDTIKNGLSKLSDVISGVWNTMMENLQNNVRSILSIVPGGGKLADKLFGTREAQATANKIKEEEQKQFELNRIALKEKQKLEKETEEAKKREKIKAEKNALQPKATATPDLKNPNAGGGGPVNVVSAPTSVVTTSSSSNTTTSTPVRQPNFVTGTLANAN
jgi:hypothetical protein